MGRRRATKPVSLAPLFAVLACGGPDAFLCGDDASCGEGGRCEPSGYCSFPADDCPSGRRFGEHSSASLAGTCVAPEAGESSSTAAASTSQGTLGDAGDTTTSSSGDATTTIGPSTDPITVSTSSSSDPSDTASSGDSSGPTPMMIGPMVIADDLDDGSMWPGRPGGPDPGEWHPSGEVELGLAYLGEFPVGSAYYGYFRFALPVGLPAGTVVVDAHFEVSGFGTYQWDPELYALEVRAELSADAPQVAGLEAYPTPFNTPLTRNATLWPGNGGLSWSIDGVNTSPDLIAPIQEVIDAAGGLESGAHVQLWITATDLGAVGREVGWIDASLGNGEFAKLTLDVIVP